MKPDIWDEQDPLAAIQGESGRANRALRDYVFLGAGRTLRALHNRYLEQAREEGAKQVPTASMDTLKRWSGQYRWSHRARAYDRAVHQEEESQWQDRWRDTRKEQWEMAQLMLQRGRDILERALEGPVRMSDAVRLIEAGLRLAHEAVGPEPPAPGGFGPVRMIEFVRTADRERRYETTPSYMLPED